MSGMDEMRNREIGRMKFVAEETEESPREAFPDFDSSTTDSTWSDRNAIS